MARNVVLIASGSTEQVALPRLLRDLAEEGVRVSEVRKPPRHHQLDARMAAALVRAVWYSRAPDDHPDKFVVLVDADRRSPEEAVEPFREFVERPPVPASLLVCAAKWHLEAWFFADAKALRDCLGRDLGRIEEAVPDDIEDPKRRLKSLLGDIYTAVDAARLASAVRPSELRKSPSFVAFEAAVRNGEGAEAPTP